MFKIAKYYFLFNWYQKSKRNTIVLMVSIILFVIAVYLFNDLIAMADAKSGLVMTKWMILLLLLAVIVFNIVQIFKSMHIPFIKDNSLKTVDLKRDKILSKEHLVSKCDRIFNKYRNEQ